MVVECEHYDIIILITIMLLMGAIKNHLLQMEPLTPFTGFEALTLEEWDCLLSCDLQHKNPDLFVRLLHTRNLIAAKKDHSFTCDIPDF